jgi:NTE family protein
MTHYIKILMAPAFVILIMISGCACPQKYQPCDPPPPPPTCLIPDKIRVALVLGGGGAKGLAHIGVLEEFEKEGIPIDLIVGCSAGSLVGAFYADCPNAAYIKTILEPMKTKWLLDINLWDARFGLAQGSAMSRVLKSKLCARNFNELQIPLLIVATDLYSSELFIIGGGPIIPAVQASCALPFIYVPVQLHGRILVDGGVIDPVPVRVAKQVGAEMIIAVDLRDLLPKTLPTNLFGVAKRSAEIALLWQSETCVSTADIIIKPKLGDVGTLDDEHNHFIYEAGKKAAQDAMPAIKARLAELGYVTR